MHYHADPGLSLNIIQLKIIEIIFFIEHLFL